MGCCTTGGKSGRRTAAQAWVLLLASGISTGGCVFGDDSDGPILAVDIQYDRSPSERFQAGSCETAGVLWVEYELLDARGKVLKRNEDTDADEDCEPGYEFHGLSPGEYTLRITGYGEGDLKRWEGECELRLDRFDNLDLCRIEQLPTPEGAPEE